MEEAEKILQSASQAVGEIPGEIQTETIEGSPAEAILDIAKNRDVDLIVMGSRGLGRLAGALLGSQSQKVVQHAQRPVLIVR
jgi:nucleotide-binding universal stress UspA family protein